LRLRRIASTNRPDFFPNSINRRCEAGRNNFPAGSFASCTPKVNWRQVLPDKEGEPYSVRYDAVNAMLLNEFLKEHGKVEQMEKQIEAPKLQKVSAQLDLTKPALQTVLNNH
jgi:hypothetical protein